MPFALLADWPKELPAGSGGYGVENICRCLDAGIECFQHVQHRGKKQLATSLKYKVLATEREDTLKHSLVTISD